MNDLRGKRPEEIFAMVADKLKDMPDDAQRLAAATDIFGKAGAGMLPGILAGSEGMRESIELARRLGVTVTDLDADNIQDMNDAWTRVQLAVKGVWTVLATNLAPALTQIAD